MSLSAQRYARGASVLQVFKATETSVVALIRRNRTKLVLKVQLMRSSADLDTITTEFQALKYVSGILETRKYFVRARRMFRSGHACILETAFVPGPTLIAVGIPKPEIWWTSLIRQLAVAIWVLESRRVLHNDFWDENIVLKPISRIRVLDTTLPELGHIRIPNAGFQLVVLDLQHAHQYQPGGFVAPLVVSGLRKHATLRRQLGWSSRFHRGGDLHQMLGILSERDDTPLRLKAYVRRHATRQPGPWPWATRRDCPAFYAERILAVF